MKRILTLIPAIAIAAALSGGANAAYDPNTNYAQVMVQAAAVGDYATGTAAESARNEKIAGMGLSDKPCTFDDLMLLSKIIYAEAGSEWLSDEWKMCVGEVVLNRVASSEFPNTIAEVLAQPGQYYGANSSYFNRLLPSERCVLGAVRLLNGERLMDDAVVFQANFRQGSGIHTAFYDNLLGWTYFCISSKSYLYEEASPVQTAAETAADEAAAETTEKITQADVVTDTDENVSFDEFVEAMVPIS